MSTRKMVQIPKPDYHHLVMERPADATEDLGPFMLGGGYLDLLCGGCDAVIASGMEDDYSLGSTAFRCQACGAYNVSPE